MTSTLAPVPPLTFNSSPATSSQTALSNLSSDHKILMILYRGLNLPALGHSSNILHRGHRGGLLDFLVIFYIITRLEMALRDIFIVQVAQEIGLGMAKIKIAS